MLSLLKFIILDLFIIDVKTVECNM